MTIKWKDLVKQWDKEEKTFKEISQEFESKPYPVMFSKGVDILYDGKIIFSMRITGGQNNG